MFQYRPVQLSYPKLENEVNILDIKDYLYLLVFLVKSETTKGYKDLEMNKTTVRNSEGQVGPRITHQSVHVYWYGDSRFFHELVTFIFGWCKGIAVGFFVFQKSFHEKK